jgi:hypothetical protein
LTPAERGAEAADFDDDLSWIAVLRHGLPTRYETAKKKVTGTRAGSGEPMGFGWLALASWTEIELGRYLETNADVIIASGTYRGNAAFRTNPGLIRSIHASEDDPRRPLIWPFMNQVFRRSSDSPSDLLQEIITWQNLGHRRRAREVAREIARRSVEDPAFDNSDSATVQSVVLACHVFMLYGVPKEDLPAAYLLLQRRDSKRAGMYQRGKTLREYELRGFALHAIERMTRKRAGVATARGSDYCPFKRFQTFNVPKNPASWPRTMAKVAGWFEEYGLEAPAVPDLGPAAGDGDAGNADAAGEARPD